MLSKLAFRNVRKTVRDYGVYLITMILVTALMFAFHSMMFSPQIKKLATVAGVMEAMIGIAADLSSSLSPGLYAILWRL